MKNRNFRPFIILALAVTILSLVSLLKIEGTIGPLEIKKIDLFSSISQNTASAKAAGNKVSQANVPAINKKTSQTDKVAEIIGPCGLEYFFEALDKIEEEGGRARIAYFGDSIIEGDLITQDFRKNFQEKFGGKGVGFMPITSVASSYRNTINHTFSKNWQVAAIHPKFNANHMPGISGFTFLPAKDTSLNGSADREKTKAYKCSWVEYEASSLFQNTNAFSVIKLYYGPVCDCAFIQYSLDDGASQFADLSHGETVKELVIADHKPAQKIKISFYAKDSAEIYGVSFEENGGVYVDSFSVIGYSGLSLNKIPTDMLAAFNSFLNYKLIIIHYGVNVSDFTTKAKFIWYRNRMVEVVKHLQSSFPEASFLIISANDIAVKEGTELATKPSIPLLVEAQKQIAQKTGAAFWNLYEAMGGMNSMASWIRGKKPLASEDGVHLNRRGGKKVADLLTEAIMKAYEAYKAKKVLDDKGTNTHGNNGNGYQQNGE